jgi:cellobiose-specific phosphotransferase system component IIB
MDIPASFYRLIIEREEMAPTEFGNKIALPHPIKPATNETFVAIGIFELKKYIDKTDLILLAPQVKYTFKDISEMSKNYNIPTILISENDYGIMNVKKS